MPDRTCVSCGALHEQTWCPGCGEKHRTPADLSLTAFLRDSFRSLTDLDARGYRSLRLLLTRPGFLTAEYAAGRRRFYLTPIQLFLAANIIFFIAAAFLSVVTFDPPLEAYLGMSRYGDIATELLRSRFIATDDVDYAAFRATFDYAARQQAKSLVIVFAGFFGLALALLRVPRREPAGVHLAFGLHYVAFALLLFVAIGALLDVIRPLVGGEALSGDSPLIPAFAIAALTVYLVPALRRVYRSGWPTAALQALVLAALWLPALWGYRLLLLFTVFHTI